MAVAGAVKPITAWGVAHPDAIDKTTAAIVAHSRRAGDTIPVPRQSDLLRNLISNCAGMDLDGAVEAAELEVPHLL
jgi:hypothetical protein